MECIIKEVFRTHQDESCGHLQFDVYVADVLHKSEVYHISDFLSDKVDYESILYIVVYNKIKELNLNTKEAIIENLTNTKYYE